MSKGRTGLLHLPVVLMLMVIVFHGYNVHFNNLTPWKGGGFGMFSTVDSRRSVSLKIKAEGGGYFHLMPDYSSRNVPARISQTLKDTLQMPSKENISRLETLLLSTDYRYTDISVNEYLRRYDDVYDLDSELIRNQNHLRICRFVGSDRASQEREVLIKPGEVIIEVFYRQFDVTEKKLRWHRLVSNQNQDT